MHVIAHTYTLLYAFMYAAFSLAHALLSLAHTHVLLYTNTHVHTRKIR